MNDKRRLKWTFIWFAFLLFLATLGAIEAEGATFSYPLFYSHPQMDTLIVMIYNANLTLRDSSKIAGPTVLTALTGLDEDSLYYLHERVWWTGAFLWSYGGVTEISKRTTATASISGAEKIEMAELAAARMLDTATVYPSVFLGGSGSGVNAWTLYFADTTGSGAVKSGWVMMPRIDVDVDALGGAPEANLRTDASGKIIITSPLDSFIVSASGQQRFWLPDTGKLSAGGQVDTFLGFSSLGSIFAAGSPPLVTVFLSYHRNGAGLAKARLVVRNENVGTDTSTGNLVGPVYEWDLTDTLGLASVAVVSSAYYHDSVKSLYDIVLIAPFSHKTLYTWNDVYIENTDTVRLTISE